MSTWPTPTQTHPFSDRTARPSSRLLSFCSPLHSSSSQTFFFFSSQWGRNKNTTVQKSTGKKPEIPAAAQRVFWKSIPKMSLLRPEHGHRARREKVYFSAFVRITDPSSGRNSLKRRRNTGEVSLRREETQLFHRWLLHPDAAELWRLRDAPFFTAPSPLPSLYLFPSFSDSPQRPPPPPLPPDSDGTDGPDEPSPVITADRNLIRMILKHWSGVEYWSLIYNQIILHMFKGFRD